MADFNYTASENNGHVVRGTLRAVDRPDLIAQLQQQNLFLISSVAVAGEEPVPPPVSVPVNQLPNSDALISRPDNFQSVGLAAPLTTRQWFLLGGVLTAGLLIGLLREHARRHPTIKNDVVDERLSHIRAGMTRDQAETFLGKSDSAPNSHVGRYMLQPGAIIDVHYDEKGGRVVTANRAEIP